MNKLFSHILLIAFMIFSIAGIWAFQYVGPGEFAKYFSAQIMGQNARIEENPFNKLAQQLEQKENELENKEIELNKKEEFLISEIQKEQERRNLIILAIVIVVVIIVLLNFFLDWKRQNKEEALVKNILQRIKK